MKSQMRGSEILEKLDYEYVELEYGVPVSATVYCLLRSFTEADVEDLEYDPPAEALEMIEQQAQDDKPGAFILRRYEPGTGDTTSFEVWGWSTR